MSHQLSGSGPAARDTGAAPLDEEGVREGARYLFANMNHGIRTPMNVVLGTCSLLERDADDPEAVRRHAATIAREGQQLLDQLDRLYDMGRLQAGLVSVVDVPFAPQELAAALAGDMRGEALERGVDFSVTLRCEEGAELLGDVSRLTAVARSLLTNAFSFTAPGGTVSLGIEVDPVDDDTARLEIWVEDTGTGISSDFIGRVFEPFAREVPSQLNPVSGSGLGLSVAQGLVELMGGTIEVESEPGEGSLFTVRVNLPCVAEAAAPAKDQAGLEGLRFLAAEDNPFSAAVLEELLDREGASVVVVPDGRQAFEAFAGSEPGTFDVLLLDHNMPVMDGLAASRAIRACGHPDAASVPIVALTANSFAEDVAASLDAGMDVHLVKPVRVELVEAAVAEARARRAALADAGPLCA